MNTYKTSEIARRFGIHPNTVRLYEELALIPKPKRQENGYRVYTDFHLEQIQLARIALKVEVLQNGLRKQAIAIIKTSALGNFDQATCLTADYLNQIRNEQTNAEEAIAITKKLLSGENLKTGTMFLTRKETADYLQISIDTLRNWELNGLLTVKRKRNGYRIYGDAEIRHLKIIRSLRCANYSLSAILRLLNTLSQNPQVDIRQTIDTPNHNDDIVSVCDQLLTSLHCAEQNAHVILALLEKNEKTLCGKPSTLTPDFALVLFFLCNEKEDFSRMETIIEVKNLYKSYVHINAVKNVNLSVCRGEVFGLLGANGAGKSTTI